MKWVVSFHIAHDMSHFSDEIGYFSDEMTRAMSEMIHFINDMSHAAHEIPHFTNDMIHSITEMTRFSDESSQRTLRSPFLVKGRLCQPPGSGRGRQNGQGWTGVDILLVHKAAIIVLVWGNWLPR